mmetsp:Transcript_52293/g.147186  ORF Transcript_52293/g.147186 Transcript_52293/m.147186 type:complete len:271 (-) Transcript_52293:1875-2687(-)
MAQCCGFHGRGSRLARDGVHLLLAYFDDVVSDGPLARVIEHECGRQGQPNHLIERVPEGDARQTVHASIHERRVHVDFDVFARSQGCMRDLVHGFLHDAWLQALLGCIHRDGVAAVRRSSWRHRDLVAGDALNLGKERNGPLLDIAILRLLRACHGFVGEVNGLVLVVVVEVNLPQQAHAASLGRLILGLHEKRHRLCGFSGSLLVLPQQRLRLGHRVRGSRQERLVPGLGGNPHGFLRGLYGLGAVLAHYARGILGLVRLYVRRLDQCL